MEGRMQGFFCGFLVLMTLFQACVPCCALNGNCSGQPHECDQCATSLCTTGQPKKTAGACGDCCCPERPELEFPTPTRDEAPKRQCPYCSRSATSSVMTRPVEIRISGDRFHALINSVAASSSTAPQIEQLRLAAIPLRETCCIRIALGKLVL